MSLLQPIVVYRREGLNASPMQPVVEAATQTFKFGAPLVWNGSGYIAEAGANPSAIVGIAQNPGHNFVAAGGPTVQVATTCPPKWLTGLVLADDPVLFEISVDDSSAQGSASAVIAQALQGTTIGITKDATTGYWYADVVKEGANQVATIVDFVDPPNTVNGRIVVKFKRAETYNQ